MARPWGLDGSQTDGSFGLDVGGGRAGRGGDDEWSATIRATAGGASATAGVTVTAPRPPAAPINLAVAKSGRNDANLTWTDNSTNETGFHVWSSRDGVTGALLSSVAADAGSGTQLSYTTGVLATGIWYFELTAYNADDDSAASNSARLVI